MTSEEQQNIGDPQALRALLVRLLIESGPGEARLEQLITALEQAAQRAPNSHPAPVPDDSWKQELAALKADIGSLRQGPVETGGAGLTQATEALEEALARSDAQLAALLEATEKRTQAELARLGTLVSALTERVSQLEAQVRRLAASRGAAGP